MKFSPRVPDGICQLLIFLSVTAILFVGFREHISSSEERSVLTQELHVVNNDISNNNNIAILPFLYKTVSVDFHALPEFLHLKKRDLKLFFDVVQPSFENAHCRNVYYVFTSINAP